MKSLWLWMELTNARGTLIREQGVFIRVNLLSLAYCEIGIIFLAHSDNS
jgi:hypothetical protein